MFSEDTSEIYFQFTYEFYKFKIYESKIGFQHCRGEGDKKVVCL